MTTPLDQLKFGKNLCAERKRLNLQAEDVATFCGVKVGTQYIYEQGKRIPNAGYLENVFAMGFRPHILFPAINQMGANTNLQLLRDAFITTDQESRDNHGRLLDLEHRVQKFIDLVTVYMSHVER